MDPMAEIKQTFFQECEDLLEEMESGLLEMEEGGADSETVNAVFRAVHSIKGGAGAFSLDALVKFAHTFETTLDEVRNDRLEASTDVMKIFLRSFDVLSDLVRAARDDDEVDEDSYAPLLNDLAEMAGIDESADAEEEEIDFEPVGIDFDLGDVGDIDLDDEIEDIAAGNGFNIQFKAKPVLYAHGNETALLFRELATIGEIKVTCDVSKVPLLDDLDPEGAYLSWNVHVTTEKDGVELWDVFEFVDGDCELTISPDAQVAENLVESSDEDAIAPIDDSAPAMVEDAAASESPVEAEAALETPAEEIEPEAAPKAAEKETKKAPAKSESTKKASTAQATVRVDLNRVDRLINLVGELVINQAMLSQCTMEAGLARASAVESRLDELKQLTRELQESVMAIRAQPVKPLFQRMSRIVREAADATGKTARLITDGENTEVDKTVIERLADPLTHMIRNAIDHGLESTEKREAAGKSAEGSVFLTAAHRSGRVVIEVADDGGGINRDRVLQIAVDKGLVPEDAKLTDNEIDNLIFMPGFSTASEVSNLSGRGVGMDVVKRSIQALGGKVSITSYPGKGSTFTISLPLTLAILDGMVVQIGTETLVVPLTAIIETWKPSEKDIQAIGADSQVISIRGEYIPVIDVGLSLGYRDTPTNAKSGVVIFVESNDQTRCALLVDDIQDQRQVVIKSLEENYGHVPFAAAATILGDGSIALILDVDALTATTPSQSTFDDTTMAATG